MESSTSLMPRYYGKTLTQLELKDLVSYLIQAATPLQPMRVSQNDKQ